MKVVKSLKLSSDYDSRYIIIINETSGEVLDDAQGYGYKTFQKALAAWNYKQKRNDKDYQKKQSKIRKCIKDNKEFFGTLSGDMFYYYKDINRSIYEEFKKEVEKENIVLDGFNTYELYKVWQREC